MTQRPQPQVSRRGALAAAIAAACAIAAPVVMHFEGKRNDPYADMVNRLTVCFGHTGPDIQRRRYSDAECRAFLSDDMARHAEGVAACTPGIVDHPRQFAAATSLAFNIGVAAYCSSTAARRFNAGDLRGGCDAFLAFDRARIGGRLAPVQGLHLRREAERRVCVSDL